MVLRPKIHVLEKVDGLKDHREDEGKDDPCALLSSIESRCVEVAFVKLENVWLIAVVRSSTA